MRASDQDSSWGFESVVPSRQRRWGGGRPFRYGLFIALLLLCVGGWWYQHRRAKVLGAVLNSTRATQTQIELAVVARVTRDFRVGEGRYPSDFQAFLRRALRPNKAYPPGMDFWGRPYALDIEPEGFVVRSAGIDGRLNTPDDLTCRATVRE